MVSSSEPLLRASDEDPTIFWDAPLYISDAPDLADTDLHVDDSDTTDDNEHTSPSKRERFRRLGRKTRSATKKALRIDDSKSGIEHNQNGVLEEIEDNPAFNPDKVFGPQRMDIGSTLDKVAGGLHVAGSAVLHPKLYAKRKAATKLATAEQPYLSLEADRALLNAYDELGRAQSSISDTSEDEESVQRLQKVVDDIEAHRESMRVSWTTSRFVHRVRVMPEPAVRFPKIEDFREVDQGGNLVRFQWEKWIGHLLLYITQDPGTRYIDDSAELPFNQDVLIQNVERIIMASAPWQAWFLRLRKVYRWEDPMLTARWFALWMFIWYLNYTISFVLCYTIFIVIQNRLQSHSIDSLRESYERALDRGTAALKFGELIKRHGSANWIDPLIEDVGPVMQMQLGDIADFLEVLINFYDWKYPEKTAATLFCMCTCVAVGILASADFALKIVMMVLIWWFFLGRLVASSSPKYRHLVTPVKYIFWDIPTHAEWSFSYLRQRAQKTRQTIIESNIQKKHDIEARDAVIAGDQSSYQIPNSSSSKSDEADDSSDNSRYSANSSVTLFDGVDFIRFHCRWHGVLGHFAVFADGIGFIRSFPKKEMWRRSFDELVEMRKITGARMANLKKEKGLELKFTDGSVDQVEAMKRRDEAFNTVIGFSGLQWQQLQPEPRKNIQR